MGKRHCYQIVSYIDFKGNHNFCGGGSMAKVTVSYIDFKGNHNRIDCPFLRCLNYKLY